MNENNIFWKLYPQSKRENISQKRVLVPEKIRKKLQKFPKEYFDGERAFSLEDIIIIKNFSIK